MRDCTWPDPEPPIHATMKRVQTPIAASPTISASVMKTRSGSYWA
jgi:hypothetical protein